MILEKLRYLVSCLSLRVSLIAVCAVQAVVLVQIVRERAAILTSGKIIEMDVAPVDPRSLFRGDYVVLSYPAGQFTDTAGDLRGLNGRREVYAVLTKNVSGEWRPTAISRRWPGAIKDGEIVMKARLDSTRRTGAPLRLRFGIESYFVPEGQGRRLEKAARAQDVRVRVAVGRDGQAVIKSVVANGEVFEEPAI